MERHKRMGFAKGSWAVYAENVWIISSFMKAEIWNGWSRNIQHTLIKTDPIKALISEFPTTMDCQSQSQLADTLHQKQSLGDYITVIRSQHI
jgi:hypothetical protein